MGTFHSFISQPLSERDANDLYKSIESVIYSSVYNNDIKNFSVISVRSFYIVVGIYKNLGNIPVELMNMATDYYWATVSDEGDYFNNSI